jgi:hypothetical protein
MQYRDAIQALGLSRAEAAGAGRSANPKFPRRLPCCSASLASLGTYALWLSVPDVP